MTAFVAYDGVNVNALIAKLLASNSRLAVDPASIKVAYGTGGFAGDGEAFTSLGYYDGSIPLGMAGGLVLSSGDISPPLSNTQSSYSGSFDTDTLDEQMNSVAQAAFSGAGVTRNVTAIEFEFVSTDLFYTGLSLELMFASDEFPEFSDTSYVDIAAVFLNGQNIGLFNGQPDQPLSVISKNLDLGNFRNNLDGTLPIEYDGISYKLGINAPLQPGVNKIKIAVADTGDTAYDSSLFVANLKATQYGGAGLTPVIEGAGLINGTSNNETFVGSDNDDQINPGDGNDIVFAGGGNDTIIGGQGDNQIDGGDGYDKVIYQKTKKEMYIKPGANDTVKVGENSDVLLNIEEIVATNGVFNFKDILTQDKITKLYIAYFGRAPDWNGLDYWLGNMNDGMAAGLGFNDQLKKVIYNFAVSDEAQKIYPGLQKSVLDTAGIQSFINGVYNNLFDRSADAEGMAYWTAAAQNYQASNVPLGTIIMDMINGAQDTPTSLDRTLIQNKAQAAWFYANQFDLNQKSWTVQGNAAEAVNILDGITADAASVNDVYVQIIGIASV